MAAKTAESQRVRQVRRYRRRRLDPPLFFALPVRLEPALRLLVRPDDLPDRDLPTLRRDVFFAPFAFDVLAFLLVDRPPDSFASDFVVLRDLPRELVLDFDDRRDPPPPLPCRAAALAVSAPTTPPMTAPTGPATLPTTAPAAAPAASFRMGGN